VVTKYYCRITSDERGRKAGSQQRRAGDSAPAPNLEFCLMTTSLSLRMLVLRFREVGSRFLLLFVLAGLISAVAPAYGQGPASVGVIEGSVVGANNRSSLNNARVTIVGSTLETMTGRAPVAIACRRAGRLLWSCACPIRDWNPEYRSVDRFQWRGGPPGLCSPDPMQQHDVGRKEHGQT